jgi:MoaA/NifB/PqqE/SkfB family radical SAM enzyme
MELIGVHLLLSYKCTYECDHCFVWGSPFAEGTMTLAQIRDILRQSEELGTVSTIFLEGGEPFLYYPVMVKAVEEARQRGFTAGIVSNAYWATDDEDAIEWLRPLAEADVSSVDLSSDIYHGEADAKSETPEARRGAAAAQALGIQCGTMAVETPEGSEVYAPQEGGTLMFRGRAVAKLLAGVPLKPWESFTECPHEELEDPGRVHVDPLGYLHLCQGITMGNLFQRPLSELISAYDPRAHPVVGPLLEGGPAELVRRYDVPHDEGYADACHLCYRSREALRPRFPEILAPDQMYGVGLNGA